MNTNFPELSPRQLSAYKEIQRIKMAWMILYVLLAIVVALTATVIILIFLERHWAVSTATGVLDSIFGTGLVKIISFHWPSKEKPTQTVPTLKASA
jgi:hypothetical protein